MCVCVCVYVYASASYTVVNLDLKYRTNKIVQILFQVCSSTNFKYTQVELICVRYMTIPLNEIRFAVYFM